MGFFASNFGGRSLAAPFSGLWMGLSTFLPAAMAPRGPYLGFAFSSLLGFLHV